MKKHSYEEGLVYVKNLPFFFFAREYSLYYVLLLLSRDNFVEEIVVLYVDREREKSGKQVFYCGDYCFDIEVLHALVSLNKVR